MAINDNWQVILHDTLQHLPNSEGVPSLRERVFPDALPTGQDYTKPHLVWYETGQSSTSGLEGRFESGVRVSLDFRSPDRLEVSRLSKAALAHLRKAKVIESVVNSAALYDFETKIRRQIVDVIIQPYLNPQANRYTRLSPWDYQFGRQFG